MDVVRLCSHPRAWCCGSRQALLASSFGQECGFGSLLLYSGPAVLPALPLVSRSSPFQSICQRYALTLEPLRVGHLRGDTSIIATSRKPSLLVSYLESYLNGHQRWLSEWKITICVSKSTAIFFARAERCFIQPRLVPLFGKPIQWVDTTRYLA